MRTRLRLLALIATFIAPLAFALAPGQADARAGFGSSFGSRGSQTWSAPPSTGVAPYTSSMQRSLTPGSSSYGYGANRGYYGGGFGSGLLGGLLGFGLAGLLLGHGLMGFGMFGLFGLLIRIAIIVFIVRWLMRMFRGPSPLYAGGPTMFAPNGAMGGGMGGGPMMSGARQGGAPIAIAPADYQAFEQLLVAVQAAWSAHDLNRLAMVLTPEMLSYLGEQLAGQTSRGVRNMVTDVRLVQGDLAEAWAEGRREYATVAMRFQMIDATYDQAGRVVDGSPTEHVTATEVWTFLRVPGGHWILSAIQQGR